MILDSDATKQQVLDHFLKLAAFDGWNDETLKIAVVQSGIDEKFTKIIFAEGCAELTEFYVESQNKKAVTQFLQIENFASKKIRDKIRLAIYERFEIEKENKLALQRLLYNNPKHMAQGLKLCYKIADAIWYGIGDQSTDFNFYTKRLTLAKIILRTLFVFVKDESADLMATKKFIDLQIEKVMKFEKVKAQVKNFCGSLKNKSPKQIIKDLPFFRLIKF